MSMIITEMEASIADHFKVCTSDWLSDRWTDGWTAGRTDRWTDGQRSWKTDWQTDRLTVSRPVFLTDWLIDWLTIWQTDLVTCRLADLQSDWQTYRRTCRLADLPTGRLSTDTQTVGLTDCTQSWQIIIVKPGKPYWRRMLSTVALLLFGCLDKLSIILKIIIYLCYKTSYIDEEVNCTEPSRSISVPCSNTFHFFNFKILYRFAVFSATSGCRCPSWSWWPSTRSSPGSTPTCSLSPTAWRSPIRINEDGSFRPWVLKTPSPYGPKTTKLFTTVIYKCS